MAEKIRLGIMFGGQSAEHAVSLESAKNVVDAINKDKYECILIGIDKNGTWHHVLDRVLMRTDVTKPIDLITIAYPVFIAPYKGRAQVLDARTLNKISEIDAVFPILHGPYGEDGTTQGFLRLLGIPFVGPSVAGSAVCMDKELTKRVLRDAGLPIGKFETLHRHKVRPDDFQRLAQSLGTPFFLKPANMGSSVGVHKVNTLQDYEKATKDAFQYDTKLILEEFIQGREIECSVLGNQNPKASVPGEVIPQHDFYSYDAKYLDENGAKLQIPANLTPDQANEVRAMAIKAFEATCCTGMARVDFFLNSSGKLLVNEINTIPGFTKISMYPKMWNQSGITYSDLIDQLITLAFERHKEERELKR